VATPGQQTASTVSSLTTGELKGMDSLTSPTLTATKGYSANLPGSTLKVGAAAPQTSPTAATPGLTAAQQAAIVASSKAYASAPPANQSTASAPAPAEPAGIAGAIVPTGTGVAGSGQKNFGL